MDHNSGEKGLRAPALTALALTAALVTAHNIYPEEADAVLTGTFAQEQFDDFATYLQETFEETFVPDVLRDDSPFTESTACRLAQDASSPEAARRMADDCASSYVGRIAIVNFGASPELAEQSTEYAEDYLHHATQGVVTPELQVLEASDAARALVADEGAGCSTYFGSNEFTLANYVSYAAIRTMPDVAGATSVVGLRSTQFCGSVGTMGIAKIDTALAEVEIADTNGASLNADNIGFIVAHEILHLYGLGHAGSLQGVLPGSNEPKNLNDNGITMQHEYFDLQAYSLSAPETYHIYGETNSPMAAVQTGSVMPQPDDVHLKPVQQHVLEQPLRSSLGIEPEMVVADTGPLRLTAEEVAEGGFGIVTLREPIRLSGKATFDRVALQPTVDGHWINGFEVLLVGEHNDYANLGTIYRYDVNSTMRLGLGVQQVTVAIEDNEFTVTPA